MVQIGDAIVSFAMFQEYFCCNPSHCKGICCVEGDAGAPVAMDEVEKLEEALPIVESEMTPEARAVVEEQGVVYCDRDALPHTRGWPGGPWASVTLWSVSRLPPGAIQVPRADIPLPSSPAPCDTPHTPLGGVSLMVCIDIVATFGSLEWINLDAYLELDSAYGSVGFAKFGFATCIVTYDFDNQLHCILV